MQTINHHMYTENISTENPVLYFAQRTFDLGEVVLKNHNIKLTCLYFRLWVAHIC